MQIEIISVTTSFTKTAKGGYSTAEVKYIEDGNRERERKIVSFSNPKVFDTIKNAEPGTTWNVTVKDDEYKNWATIEPTAGEAPPKSAAALPSKAAPTTSQYETRDERNARQRLIVRQSSLSNAIEILTAGAKSPPLLADVAQLADALVAYVYEAPSLVNMPNDLGGLA